MTRYKLFDYQAVRLRDLCERGHDLDYEACWPLAPPYEPYEHPRLGHLVRAIHAARQTHRAVIVILGGHPIKLGLSRYLVDLIQRRWVTHLALNGAGVIHDFELALAGGTSEDVASWIQCGQFGLWRETSRLNEIISEAASRNEGLGEAVGRAIEEEQSPYRQLSICRAGWCAAVPVTSHVTIGADILHAMPNCDGAAVGSTTMTDFRIFARAVADLEGGVLMNIGSAVTGPEVFLKALSMARNLAHQSARRITRFTTAVFDLVHLPEDASDAPPPKDEPLYYFRPWKTLLCRTVAGGGNSYYFEGDHRQTIPTLWQELVDANGDRFAGKVENATTGGFNERLMPAANASCSLPGEDAHATEQVRGSATEQARPANASLQPAPAGLPVKKNTFACDAIRTGCIDWRRRNWGATAMGESSEARGADRMPPLRRQAWDLAGFVFDGGRTVTKQQYKQRLMICNRCDRRRANRCLECGCRLSLKARGRAFDCPLGKWPQISESRSE